MAIMWDAADQQPSTTETPADVAWRLRFAQVLIASGFEAAIIREALVANGGTMPHFAVPEWELTAVA